MTKTVFVLALTLMLLGGLNLVKVLEAEEIAPSLVTLSDGTNLVYHTINEAVNGVVENGKVEVINGTWNEYVRIRKAVTLISLNSSRRGVVIDGKYRNYPDAEYMISVNADNVTIAGFTFLNSRDLLGIGIYAENRRNLVIANNTFEPSTVIGIFLVNVTNVTIFNNQVESYCMPLLMHESNNVSITYNTFRNGAQNINIYNSQNLVFHHNNIFFKPLITPHNYVYNTTGRWDDEAHGNYWSDYNGTDRNLDGIGDAPYQITTIEFNGWEYFDYRPLMTDPQFNMPNPSGGSMGGGMGGGRKMLR